MPATIELIRAEPRYYVAQKVTVSRCKFTRPSVEPTRRAATFIARGGQNVHE